MKGVVLKKALNIFNLAFTMSVLKLFFYINRNVFSCVIYAQSLTQRKQARL